MGGLQNNSSIGWLHPKSTHAHPLAWASKKLTYNSVTLSIQPSFDSLTLIPAQKAFPQCLCRTEPKMSELKPITILNKANFPPPVEMFA
jgi:hypothetical protein